MSTENIQFPCECGCGNLASPGRRFIWPHQIAAARRNRKHWPQMTAEQKEKMAAGRKSVRVWNKKDRVEIQCACGCGESLITPDEKGRDRKFINDHFAKTLVWERARPYGPSPILGRKASDETRRKLSESHKGRPSPMKGIPSNREPWNKGKRGLLKHSDETRIRISLSRRGEKSHLWKGGIPQRQGRTRTIEWKITRGKVYQRDDWKCAVCSRHCSNGNIICHHILPFRHGGTDDMSNLTTVCRKCHSRQEWLYGTEEYHWFSVVGLSEHGKDNPRNIDRLKEIHL